MIINIYTDGASRANPGKSASGYMLLDEDGGVLLKKSFYNGIKTNNEAEYLAIIGALDSTLHEYGADVEISLFSDSKLAISQLSGDYKVKNAGLKKLNLQTMELLRKFSSYSLHNVPREDLHISEVDSDLNDLLDKYEKEYK